MNFFDSRIIGTPRGLKLLTFSMLFLLLPAISGWAQHRTATHRPPVMAQIEEAYRQGHLSLDQKVLYKFYAGLQPEKLPKSFLHEGTDNRPAKCGTPAHIDYLQHKSHLSRATILEIESLASSRETSTSSLATYLSPSGKFVLHYEVAGTDAVPADDSNANGIPDYVEWTAAAADSSWRHEVERLGYTDPVLSGDPYDIYFRNFGFYGQTVATNETTYIEIHNNFQGFPPNTDPEGNVRGAIKATMAHELKHAIQYANSQWYESPLGSESPHSFNWTEMDATLMEEVVYDNVNDYYNYLFTEDSIFLSPEDGIPGAYWQVSWFIFFEEKFGSSFWVNVWSRIKERFEQGNENNYLGMIEAIEVTLEEDFLTDLKKEFIESHLWHYVSGPDFQTNFGFEEKEHYPQTSKNDGSEFLTNNFSIPRNTSKKQLNSYSASYFEINTNNTLTGDLLYELILSENNGIGLIAFLKDGDVQTQILLNSDIERGKILDSNWDWDNINSLGVVLANPSSSMSSESSMLFIGEEKPNQLTLSQNFPNPFNPTTEIRFSLSQESQVQLKVYDITGRLVKSLIDETLAAGVYQKTFNAGNLASGLYFYQLVTDQRVLSRKMMLIK